MNKYHIKRSGLTGHYFVMLRGDVYFATRSIVVAYAVRACLSQAA